MSKYAGFSLAYICVCTSLGAARWVALTSVARDGLHLKSLTSKLSLHFGVLRSLFLSEAPNESPKRHQIFSFVVVLVSVSVSQQHNHAA